MSQLEARPASGPTVMLVTGLQLAHAAVVDLDRVPRVLGAPDAPWLGQLAPDQEPPLRSFLCDLELHAGGSERALFRKAAVVSLGRPRGEAGGWVVPIEWRAAGLTALFPVLVGDLHIRSDGLEIHGRYAPPGGRLGHLLDTTLLGTAARQTGRWFLRRLAAELA